MLGIDKIYLECVGDEALGKVMAVTDNERKRINGNK